MIEVRRPIAKTCPYKDEVDVGELLLRWIEDAPELHALADEIDRLASRPSTHEDFTRRAREVADADYAETNWRTGPWSARVVEQTARWDRTSR